MPSRRTLLTAMAAALGGCVGGPDPGTDGTPTTSPSATDAATVSFDAVDVAEVPDGDSVLVVSSKWRDWLRNAADGTTVRAATHPEDCGRAPIRDVAALALRDAGDHAGEYDVGLRTGGYYEPSFRAEPTTPPEDAPVVAFEDVPAAVQDDVGTLLDEGAAGFPRQTRAFEFLRSHSLDDAEYKYLLYVRRDGTTYRVYARVPTLTPPCGYYVVLSLSPVASTPGTVLSLAGEGSLAPIRQRAEHEAAYDLSAFPSGARQLVERFDYCMTLTQGYRMRVQR